MPWNYLRRLLQAAVVLPRTRNLQFVQTTAGSPSAHSAAIVGRKGAVTAAPGDTGQSARADDTATVVQDAERRLIDAGIEETEAKASVRWLLENAKRSSGDAWRTMLAEGIDRRARREPVQYILGEWPFYPLRENLILRPPVLIPRPETEELVNKIIAWYVQEKRVAPARFVDIGSGSGAIVVTLLQSFPLATALAVEPLPEAAALTMENARRNGVSDRLEVKACSARSWADSITESRGADFDLIVSNPPYIPAAELLGLDPEVRDFESPSALDGGEDGLSVVREVLDCARRAGSPGAQVFLEVHHTHPEVFTQSVQKKDDRLLGADLHLVATESDIFGNPRFVHLEVTTDANMEQRASDSRL